MRFEKHNVNHSMHELMKERMVKERSRLGSIVMHIVKISMIIGSSFLYIVRCNVAPATDL